MSFRLLPLIIISCVALLAIKLADYATGSKHIDSLIFTNLKAEEGKKDQEKKEDGKEEKADEKKEEGQDKKEVKEEKKQEKPRDIKSEQTYSPTELEILRRLSERRDELERRETSLDEKEKLLGLTELNINKKIDELNLLKGEVEKLLAQYNEKEDAKINSLVKIYENMKPKAAAPIFEQMDMNTLLSVVNKMKEAKVAPILAQMNPEKARQISEEFAKQKKLQ